MDLPRGARHIFSMDGDRKITLDELEDGASYVVSSYKTFKVSEKELSIYRWFYLPITSPDKNLSEARERRRESLRERERENAAREEEALLSNQVYYACLLRVFEKRKRERGRERVLIGHRRKSGSFDLIHCTKKK